MRKEKDKFTFKTKKKKIKKVKPKTITEKYINKPGKKLTKKQNIINILIDIGVELPYGVKQSVINGILFEFISECDQVIKNHRECLKSLYWDSDNVEERLKKHIFDVRIGKYIYQSNLSYCFGSFNYDCKFFEGDEVKDFRSFRKLKEILLSI